MVTKPSNLRVRCRTTEANHPASHHRGNQSRRECRPRQFAWQVAHASGKRPSLNDEGASRCDIDAEVGLSNTFDPVTRIVSAESRPEGACIAEWCRRIDWQPRSTLRGSGKWLVRASLGGWGVTGPRCHGETDENQSEARRAWSRHNLLPSESARTCHGSSPVWPIRPDEHRTREGVRTPLGRQSRSRADLRARACARNSG
jgi:hypothetical protein